ncbi:MAG TPA: IclR family transcriptional regulator [Aldersonia sp.]
MTETTTTPARTDMVGKALHVVRTIGAGSVEGRTLTEISRDTGYPLSTVHRLIATLSREGFVELDEPTKRYRIGLTVFGLAQRAAAARGFDGVALPVLRRLAAETGESALMSVLDGDHQLYLHHVHGPSQVNVIGEPGEGGPLHCTSMGKVLVAFASTAVREGLVATLDLQQIGPNAITDRAAFGDEISRVRELGYAVADEEHEAGIRAVGVPILASDGTASVAISVAAPSFRRSRDEIVAMVPALVEAARELAVTLPPR